MKVCWYNDTTSTSKIKLRFEGEIPQQLSITHQQWTVLLDDTQVGLMVQDPEKYLRDYKVGTHLEDLIMILLKTLINMQNYHFQQHKYTMGDGDYDNLCTCVVTHMRVFKTL